METIYTHCAGLDAHKKTVVASRIYKNAQGERVQETQTFSTLTHDLLRLSDWLQQASIVRMAMESTGEYWKLVYNILRVATDVMGVSGSLPPDLCALGPRSRRATIRAEASVCRDVSATGTAP
jgi:hypothetical protein